MPRLNLVRFQASSSPRTDTTLSVSLAELASSKQSSLWLSIPQKNTVELVSEAIDEEESTAEHHAFAAHLQESLGTPLSSIQVDLQESSLGPDGPAAANVVEFVQNWFPASRITPELQRDVEEAFATFNAIFETGATGAHGLVTGWSVDETDRPQIPGEKARCFFVMRGWDAFEDFKTSGAQPAFKEALPHMLKFKAPHEMWHVERLSAPN